MPITNFLPSSRIAQPGVCTSTTRPASPYNGLVVYETDTGKTQVWNGSAWVMLTNSNTPPGLELVKTQAVGSTVTSTTMTGVFSSTYENYRLVYSGGVGSNNIGLGLQVGGSTSNYSHVLFWTTPGVASVNCDTSSNTTQANYVGGGTTSSALVVCDILSPYNSSRYTSFCTGAYQAGDFGFCQARHNIAQSNTSVTLMTLSGTMTGGTIRVYGYRDS